MVLLFAASGTEKDTNFPRVSECGNLRGDAGKVTVRVPPVGHLGSGYSLVVMSAI